MSGQWIITINTFKFRSPLGTAITVVQFIQITFHPQLYELAIGKIPQYMDQ